MPHCLNSLAKQSRKPDEVVIVLKPSGDGSEDIIEKFKELLSINVVVQKAGNVTDAVAMAIRAATGDYILFIDDDAIAHEE